MTAKPITTRSFPTPALMATAVAAAIWVANCVLLYEPEFTCRQTEPNWVMFGLAVATIILAAAGEATLSARRTRTMWKAAAWGLLGLLIQVPVVLISWVVASASHNCFGN